MGRLVAAALQERQLLTPDQSEPRGAVHLVRRRLELLDGLGTSLNAAYYLLLYLLLTTYYLLTRYFPQYAPPTCFTWNLMHTELNAYMLHLAGRADCMQPRHVRQSHRAARVQRLSCRHATGRERRLELWRMLSGLELQGGRLTIMYVLFTVHSLLPTPYNLLLHYLLLHYSRLASGLFTSHSIRPTTPLLTAYYSRLASDLFATYSLQPTTPLLTAYYYWYGKAGSAAALPCAAGRFGNTTDLQATEQCALCPVGHSCSTGSSAPTPCSPGTHADRIGLPACHACSSGTYQSATSSRRCLVCVPGYGICCQARTPE